MSGATNRIDHLWIKFLGMTDIRELKYKVVLFSEKNSLYFFLFLPLNISLHLSFKKCELGVFDLGY